jgi:hypothetical protein
MALCLIHSSYYSYDGTLLLKQPDELETFMLVILPPGLLFHANMFLCMIVGESVAASRATGTSLMPPVKDLERRPVSSTYP